MEQGKVILGGVLVTATAFALYSLFKKQSGDSQSKPQSTTGVNGRAIDSMGQLFEELSVKLSLTYPKLVAIRENFLREIRDGLRFNNKSSMPMIPTLVTHRASGKEEGIAYAIDFGGTNVRVLKCQLQDGAVKILKVAKKKLPSEYISSSASAEDLFDFLASVIVEVVDNKDEDVKLGFTFSFPYHQTAINSGVLINWTKEFATANVEGEDVCKLLAEALDRNGAPNIQVDALLNDTVGTLMAGSFLHTSSHHSDEGCLIGLILGTGANACYLEKLNKITKMEGVTEESEGDMIINMECGNFGASRLRPGHDLHLTQYDQELDQASANTGTQILEKQMSGRYLGEVVRLILRDAMAKGVIFTAYPQAFRSPYSFSSEEMSLIEGDSAPFKQTSNILHEHGVPNQRPGEREFVAKVCHLVARRSARLAATLIAGILKHTHTKSSCLVAVDGSLFEKYPKYKEMMEEALKPLHAHPVSLLHTEDGSGVGAIVTGFVMGKK
eukprot:TRINITY_DN2803_c0_g2_i1.p1 TRINITY_DN2803_c0_g2~~TRINITY_DN2803_c0_g2_i1.p1  ORF type:complete len:513 (+),score=148.21 TRINITY_DN2803_c0_g2_i1:46-1539(+)